MALIKKNTLTKPIVITPPHTLEMPNFKEVWEARDLLFFITERNIKVRFQQTIIGVLWIALQPIIQMLIFYVILGLLVKVPTDGIPYPVFYLSGFIVWQYFSQIVNGNAFSLLENISIIVKCYFPRLILPFASTASALVDFAVSFVLLLIILFANHYTITARYLLLPVLLLITTLFSSGIGLLFGALMVSFRDVRNLLAFILMIWMYLTPIIYPSSLVPGKFRLLLSLNPLTSLVEAFRWVFLGTGTLPPLPNILVSISVATILWLVGAIAFRNMENRIADVM